MIRTVTNKNGDFISIHTSLEVKGRDSNVKVPVYVEIKVTDLNESDYGRVYRASYGLFNRNVTLDLTKSTRNEKPWWKKLFN